MTPETTEPRGGNRGAPESNLAGRPDSPGQHTDSRAPDRQTLRPRARAREPLTGCRCECPTCLEWFGSVRAFERHRTGYFASPGTFQHNRRCYSEAELTAAGWTLNERGFWLTPDPRRVREAQS